MTKLASNWFGDKERGTATSIGIVSGPLGIFISKVLILSFFDEGDKQGMTPLEETRGHWHGFIFTQSLITMCMVTPALLLVREKPPSPPSIVATKPRPVQTFAQSYRGLLTNHNYILIFWYFQCVNTVAIYGGEIQPFTDQYDYSLLEQTMASMLNCVAGIIGSIWLGKFLDRHKCFKKMQVAVAVAIGFMVLLTFLGLHFDWYNGIVLAIIILAGAPMSSVSVVSYQFAAEVIYPIGEVQGVSIMNTINKLLSFGMV